MTDKKIRLLKQLNPKFDPECELCMFNYGDMTIKEIEQELRESYGRYWRTYTS